MSGDERGNQTNLPPPGRLSGRPGLRRGVRRRPLGLAGGLMTQPRPVVFEVIKNRRNRRRAVRAGGKNETTGRLYFVLLAVEVPPQPLSLS